MNRWCALLLMMLLSAGQATGIRNAPISELELSGFTHPAPVSVFLSEDDRRWLQQRKTVRVAVFDPALPPLVQTTLTGRYRGINADYLALIQQSLNIRLRVIDFKDRGSAVAALRANEVDTVLTGLESAPFSEPGIELSVPLVHAWPVLVATLANVMAPLQSMQSLRIATVDRYPHADYIRRSFPNAVIINYSHYQEALSSVARGDSAWFIGDSLTTGSWLSQEFSQVLSAVEYWPAPQKTSHFLFSASDPRLLTIINSTLKAIDRPTQGQIIQATVDKGDLSFLDEPLDLTPREKQWLSNHKKLKVIINPWFAPYTMVDGDLNARGVAGDILNLIALQTGLEFETVVVNTAEEMRAEMKKGGWHILQPATYDINRENNVSFTHPFLTTQFVTVVRKEDDGQDPLRPDARVAISADSALLQKMKAQYPKVRWEAVKNSSVAINRLATGKVDAAITNQITARYLSDHYYPERLSWSALSEQESAPISFAVPRSEPELRQILEKSLDNIPQKEIFQIVSKWIGLPEVKIQTWELYNRPFYLVIALATLLVISTLIWAVYLAREVGRRKRSQRLLENERNRAERANEEKRDFLSHMSHEIRTPVSAIMGFLELLQLSSARYRYEDKAAIDQAALASRSLLKLIGEILDLEKIESGLLDVTPQWVNADALIKEKIALFSALAAQKGIVLENSTRLNPQEAMLFDPQLLGQVLTNLIGNAVKFTHRGFIRLTASGDNGTLRISVQDSGPGMSEEEQERLFTAFSQGKAGEHHSGSGLGLAICRALMTQMNGTISLESAVGQGTTATVSLPVEISAEAVPETPESAAPLPEKQTSLRVLIADDHPSSRLLLKSQLATLGIRADEASNGDVALHTLRQADYDLLITDLNMPIMDGIALTREVRRINDTLIIWGLTATAEEHERERCLAAGMNACLFKPVTLSQISSLLSGVSGAERPAFDMERLAMLAQGNRQLMLTALEDAQRENRRDLAAARTDAAAGDLHQVKLHIHRINGTAQLLGVNELMATAQSLEARLPSSVTAEQLLSELEYIDALLDALDRAIDKFVP